MARYPEVQYIRIYSEGSAARELERKPARKISPLPEPKPRAEKKIVIRIDPVATAGIVVAAIMLIMMIAGFAQLSEAAAQTHQLERYVAELQEKNAGLQEAYRAGYDLEQIEKTALSIGMVPMDQVTHVRIQLPPEPVELSWWEQVQNFFTGLFA